jgi:hypothetical protein
VWRRARLKAGLAGGEFTFHDIKAKSLSDSPDMLDAMKRVGHLDMKTTQRVYLRKPTRVIPLPRVSGKRPDKGGVVDLKDFVSATLTQIVTGVAEAQNAVRDAGGCVNPAIVAAINRESYIGSHGHGEHVYAVAFDVAVTVAESTGTNAGAKLQIASLLSLGAGGESRDASSSTSRVKFNVPLALPVDSASKETLAADDAGRSAKRAEEQRKVAEYNSQGGF